MHRTLTTALIIIAFSPSYAQPRLEAQLGGSNFFGLTLNSAYDISISKKGNQYLSPSFGIGILAPWWDEPTSIIHLGLNYQRKNWGAGLEASTFPTNLLWGDGKQQGFVDLIAYPNINYILPIGSNWYTKISGGAYFAFSRRGDPYSGNSYLAFEGDVIPGGGLSAGYKF